MSVFYNTESNNSTVKKIDKVIVELVHDPFIPWSSAFESSEMTKAALTATDVFFDVVIPNRSYEITVDKSLPVYEITWIKEMLNYTNGALFNLQNNTMKVFVSGSTEWSEKTLKNNNLWLGDPNSKFPCSTDIRSEAHCAQDNLILVSFFDILPNQDWFLSRRATPAHEVFHVFQDSLSGLGINVDPSSPRAIPTWLVEGSANYYGYYVVDRMGFDKYEDHKTTRSWFDYKNNNQVSLIEYNDFSLDPYIIGQMATEYLVASAGFKSLVDIFKFSKTEKTFSAAFKKATGITLKEFYEKFEIARASM